MALNGPSQCGRHVRSRRKLTLGRWTAIRVLTHGRHYPLIFASLRIVVYQCTISGILKVPFGRLSCSVAILYPFSAVR